MFIIFYLPLWIKTYQNEDDGVELMCFPRTGELGRVDVLGSKALQLLQKILHPISWYSFISLYFYKFSIKLSRSKYHLILLFLQVHCHL